MTLRILAEAKQELESARRYPKVLGYRNPQRTTIQVQPSKASIPVATQSAKTPAPPLIEATMPISTQAKEVTTKIAATSNHAGFSCLSSSGGG